MKRVTDEYENIPDRGRFSEDYIPFTKPEARRLRRLVIALVTLMAAVVGSIVEMGR